MIFSSPIAVLPDAITNQVKLLNSPPLTIQQVLTTLYNQGIPKSTKKLKEMF